MKKLTLVDALNLELIENGFNNLIERDDMLNTTTVLVFRERVSDQLANWLINRLDSYRVSFSWMTAGNLVFLSAKERKVKTIKDIISDHRVDEFIHNYDGPNKHAVILKDGYGFDGERSLEIGTIKEICYSMNNTIESYKHR